MKKSLITHALLAGSIACASATQAAQDRPQDYAWRMQLTPAAGAGLNRLQLPREVYLHARTQELADLRIFDADGKAQAFAIGAPAAQVATERRQIAARIFPVRGTDNNSEGLPEVEIRTGSDGRLLSVRARSSAGAYRTGDALQALILDLGIQQAGSAMTALHFALPSDSGSYSAQVLLEASDDLKQWDAIGTTTLDWLRNSDTQTLANDSMRFAPRSFRYARISWQDGQPLAFASIHAEAVSQTATLAPRASVSLQGKPGKEPGQRLYATPPAIPADSIGLQIRQENTVLPVTLGVFRTSQQSSRQRLYRQSRPAQASQIEPVLNATFYRLGHGDKERISGDLSIPVMHTTQWILHSALVPDFMPDQAPVLRLGWTPDTLFFLANGRPPYQLVFGNGKASRMTLPLSQLAPGFQPAELLALPAATTGALLAQAGAMAEAQAASPATASNARWRLAALWGALLLGVAVLGFFAWRLLAQMRQEQARTQEHDSAN